MKEEKALPPGNKIAERDLYSVYTLNGVTYLPHYHNESVYVGPAYDKTRRAYSPEVLIRHGAKKVGLYLWRRGTTGRIENVIT